MSLALIVYLAGIAEPLKNFLGLFGVVLLIIGVIWWLMSEESYEPASPPPKKLLPSGALLLLLGILVPNKETIYTMVAAKTVEDIATSPKVQELGGKSLDVINKVMDDYLKENKEEK